MLVKRNYLQPPNHVPNTGIYFIEGEGTKLMKIGRGASVRDRLSTMQSGSPVPLILQLVLVSDDLCVDEHEIHERFKHLRKRGEWFILAPELQDFVTACQKVPNITVAEALGTPPRHPSEAEKLITAALLKEDSSPSLRKKLTRTLERLQA